MKRKKLLIYIGLIAVITIALTMIPIQFLYAPPPGILLNDSNLESNGYICGTDRHWVKFDVKSQPHDTYLLDITKGYIPPNFTTGGVSEFTAAEIMSNNGDYIMVDFNSDPNPTYTTVNGCQYRVDWKIHEAVKIRHSGCCPGIEWIKIWYTGPVIACPSGAPAWVRTMPMMCQYVWINEDGHFQFIWLYPFADNNWVRIYAMNADGTAGDMVFEADIPWDNPNLIVDLPDGMYIVMTFHDQPDPIQTFVIGKP